MAKKLEAPKWRPDAKIDPRGWRCPKNGELLVARKFSAEDIAAYNESIAPKEEKPKAKKKKAAPKKKTIAEKVVEIVKGEVKDAE